MEANKSKSHEDFVAALDASIELAGKSNRKTRRIEKAMKKKEENKSDSTSTNNDRCDETTSVTPLSAWLARERKEVLGCQDKMERPVGVCSKNLSGKKTPIKTFGKIGQIKSSHRK